MKQYKLVSIIWMILDETDIYPVYVVEHRNWGVGYVHEGDGDEIQENTQIDKRTRVLSIIPAPEQSYLNFDEIGPDTFRLMWGFRY